MHAPRSDHFTADDRGAFVRFWRPVVRFDLYLSHAILWPRMIGIAREQAPASDIGLPDSGKLEEY
jgi:hypothetical protein